MEDFNGKTILVTGAAGNLGGSVVKAFLKSGGGVVGLDHGTGRLAGKFDSDSLAGTLYPFDGVNLTDRQAVLDLANQVRDQVGMVDIIVHTVGGFTAGDSVHTLPISTFQKMIDLNIATFLNTAAGFVPQMIEKGAGKVITIGARSALSGGAKTGAYAAAKGALLRLTESMAAELSGENIQVNCVLPSTIDTPDNRKAMPKADFSKWVKPDDLAKAILFLASSSADAISGAAVPVYGRA